MFSLLWCLGSMHMTSAQTLRAGASTIDISPALGEPIVGNWNSPPATHIHDPLQARTIVLADGQNTIALVVADNVGIVREVFDEAKRLIEAETDLPKEHIMMSSTHTHSGTSAAKTGQKRKGYDLGKPLDAYQTFVARRMAEGVRIALNNLEDAQLAFGTSSVPEHVFNRRWMMKEPVMGPLGELDKAKMNPGNLNPDLVEPAGPIDPEVSFISVQAKDGRPIALLANYSLHYVGGIPKGHISADYFAVFADRVQELIGADRQHPPFVGIMTNGTSGDINNINFGKARENNLPYAKMTIVGNDVAKSVVKSMQSLTYSDDIEIGAQSTELKLDVRRASPALLANLAKIEAHQDEDNPLFNPLEKTYARNIATLENEWPDQIDVVLQALKIGDIGIAAIPFEVLVEIGLELKEEIPFEHAFTVSLANGAYGYLPPPVQHEKGGYETWLSTNRVEIHASEKIVAELLDLFSILK